MNTHQQLHIKVLGSGTSAGVPMIGCHCPVCRSPDPRDRRNRCALAIRYGPHTILVDTPPELRLQAVTHGVDRIDAIVMTHAHADHIFGLDDVRRFNTILGAPLPLYANAETLTIIQRCFGYAFTKPDFPGVYRPELVPELIQGPFDLLGRHWLPVPMVHGRTLVYGYRIGNFAYCTDCNEIPATSRALLKGLDVLILGALRPQPHPAHLSFAQALELVAELQPRRTWFTHLSHDLRHAEIEADLPESVRVSYDGLEIVSE
ncbi:MAG: MBL fold metallo-hydrolase [Phycisphaerae bacterium]